MRVKCVSNACVSFVCLRSCLNVNFIITLYICVRCEIKQSGGLGGKYCDTGIAIVLFIWCYIHIHIYHPYHALSPTEHSRLQGKIKATLNRHAMHRLTGMHSTRMHHAPVRAAIAGKGQRQPHRLQRSALVLSVRCTPKSTVACRTAASSIPL